MTRSWYAIVIRTADGPTCTILRDPERHDVIRVIKGPMQRKDALWSAGRYANLFGINYRDPTENELPPLKLGGEPVRSLDFEPGQTQLRLVVDFRALSDACAFRPEQRRIFLNHLREGASAADCGLTLRDFKNIWESIRKKLQRRRDSLQPYLMWTSIDAEKNLFGRGANLRFQGLNW